MLTRALGAGEVVALTLSTGHFEEGVTEPMIEARTGGGLILGLGLVLLKLKEVRAANMLPAPL